VATKSFLEALVYHLIALLVIGIVVGGFGANLSPDSEISDLRQIFLLLGLTALGHLLAILFSSIDEATLLIFFLVDAPIVFVLVRATGASASPFLVLYPLLSLSGTVALRPAFSLFNLALVLGFHVFSVGFGPQMIGNAMATIATSVLGFYLVKALRKSDAALEVSEDQRLRLENLQRAILANMPSGLLSVDSQGQVIQVNAVGVKILGMNENDILYKPLKTLIPELGDQVVKLNTLVPAINQFAYEKDRPSVKYLLPTGELLQLGFSVARLLDPKDKSILGSLVVFQDLTHVIKMEQDLRLSEKLAAVGKLAAGIAHEIRNPLAGISGSAQLLLGSDELSDEDKKLLQIIQRESTSLDSLITEFLEYVRPAKAKMENIDLLQIAENVIQQMKVHSKVQGSRCAISIKNMASSLTTLPAKGDANKITQVLINLVINSVQAGARAIEVRVSADPPSIEVRDDGSGISPENQRRIFEPFFTTKESGTGLGLAVSYRALEAMDAKIVVESPLDSGRGTAIRVHFRKDAA
jgi:two-component system, NtrC family, sensor histidine kinase PilS